MQNDEDKRLPKAVYVPFWVSDDCATVGLRLLKLFEAEPAEEDRREMMDCYIDFLYWRDLYPRDDISELHDCRTPAELVWATVSLANRRIDDLMAMFPDLHGHPEPDQLVKKLIPSLEAFLDIE